MLLIFFIFEVGHHILQTFTLSIQLYLYWKLCNAKILTPIQDMSRAWYKFFIVIKQANNGGSEGVQMNIKANKIYSNKRLLEIRITVQVFYIKMNEHTLVVWVFLAINSNRFLGK